MFGKDVHVKLVKQGWIDADFDVRDLESPNEDGKPQQWLLIDAVGSIGDSYFDYYLKYRAPGMEKSLILGCANMKKDYDYMWFNVLSSRENDPRSAAHFILKLRLHAQLGAEDGEETLARLEDELAEVPGDAVHLFLAAQAMPGAPPRELLVQALREHRRIMAVSSISPTILDLVETMAPFASSGDGPAILMVLSSERMVFYEGVYGQEGLEDQLDLYGPTLEPIRVEGEHFDVVTRCISNRVPEFTSAVEHFLSAQGEAEYSSDA